MAASLGLQLLVIYSPIAPLLDAVPLGLGPWLVIAAGLALALPLGLGVGWVVRRAFGSL